MIKLTFEYDESGTSEISAFAAGVKVAESELAKKFPNDITSYLKTHYLIVEAITYHLDFPESKAYNIHEQQGFGGLCDLAEELTDKFELEHKDREWDGEFLDEISDFIHKHLE